MRIPILSQFSLVYILQNWRSTIAEVHRMVITKQSLGRSCRNLWSLVNCSLLPGVMMIEFASLIISMAWSIPTSVCVPTTSMGFPPAVDVVPYPPKMTFGKERFIAWPTINHTLTQSFQSMKDSNEYKARNYFKHSLLRTDVMYMTASIHNMACNPRI